MVLEFTISLYGSSCNIFVGLIESKRARVRLENRYLHELPYIEIVNSGTIRVSSDLVSLFV